MAVLGLRFCAHEGTLKEGQCARWGYSSVVEYTLSVHDVLGSIASTSILSCPSLRDIFLLLCHHSASCRIWKINHLASKYLYVALIMLVTLPFHFQILN